MGNNTYQKHIALVGGLVFLAALSRIIPHYPNFTALGAMTLFGASQLRTGWQALLVTVLALYISDLVINNVIYAAYYDYFTWQISPFVYVAFLLIFIVGRLLRNRVTVANVAKASLASSLLFFLLTNGASWWIDPLYAKNMTGLATAYTAGLPFFWSTLAGDLFYCGVLFGGYALVQRTHLAGAWQREQ